MAEYEFEQRTFTPKGTIEIPDGAIIIDKEINVGLAGEKVVLSYLVPVE